MVNLEALALRRLGSKDLIGLLEWYGESIEAQVEYVVFVVRRSYILSLILEFIAGKKMEDGEHKKYVTDSAFLLCCEELAKHYKAEKEFPKIRLCDDILIHGRNLNRVIENIEERLVELLPDEDVEDIKNALAEAIQIRVYCYAVNDYLYLMNRYSKVTQYKVRYEAFQWRELSSHISSLIIESGIANATYINSEIIHSEEFDRVVKDRYKRHLFQNIEGYTKIKLLGNGDGDVYAIYTLRLLKNENNNFTRVIPFVFMPNLDKEETGLLYNSIRKAAAEKQYRVDFLEKLKDLFHINGRRAFNEWISLIISNTILQEFNKKYNINIDDSVRNQEIDEEIIKLARNYRFNDDEEHLEYLKQCIKDNPIFTSVEELNNVLAQCNRNRPIMRMGDQSMELNEMRRRLEDYFYSQGFNEEMEAMQLYRDPNEQISVSNRSVRNCWYVFKELMTGLTGKSVAYMVSNFLLMMDAGVLSLSSNSAKNLYVHGYAQFAKAGEQSLLIMPLRYLEFFSFLIIAYDWCRRYAKDFYSDLREFAASKYSSISEEMMEELIKFLKLISALDQTVLDWSGSYVEKVFDKYEHQEESFTTIEKRYIREYCNYIDKA